MPDFFEFHAVMMVVMPWVIGVCLWVAAVALAVRGYRRIRAVIRLSRAVADRWRKVPGELLSVTYQVRGSVAANTHGPWSAIAVTYRYRPSGDLEVEHQAAAPLLCDADLPALAKAMRDGRQVEVYVDPVEPLRAYLQPSSHRAQVQYINREMKLPLQLFLVAVALSFAVVI